MKTLPSLVLLASLSAAVASGQTSYFVDFGGGVGDSTGNVLNWPARVNDNTANQTGLNLIDFATGQTSAITISTAGFDGYGPNDGRNLSSTGDVGVYLSPINFIGSISVAQDPLKTATMTFSNLDPFTTYEITVSGDRNNGTSRNSIFTIVGAETFVNASSVGATISGASNETTTLITGDNSGGLVARYINVTSGMDGIVTIEMISTNNRAYVNGLSLVAIPEPSSYAALLGLTGLGFCLVRRRRR